MRHLGCWLKAGFFINLDKMINDKLHDYMHNQEQEKTTKDKKCSLVDSLGSTDAGFSPVSGGNVSETV